MPVFWLSPAIFIDWYRSEKVATRFFSWLPPVVHHESCVILVHQVFFVVVIIPLIVELKLRIVGFIAAAAWLPRVVRRIGIALGIVTASSLATIIILLGLHAMTRCLYIQICYFATFTFLVM